MKKIYVINTVKKYTNKKGETEYRKRAIKAFEEKQKAIKYIEKYKKNHTIQDIYIKEIELKASL